MQVRNLIKSLGRQVPANMFGTTNHVLDFTYKVQGIEDGLHGLNDGEGVIDGGLQAGEGATQADSLPGRETIAIGYDDCGLGDGLVKRIKRRLDGFAVMGVEGVLGGVDFGFNFVKGISDEMNLRAC
ncbi:hypothetical protein PgNI_05468 [Pyricularia grisea]|uniref:Uncharacterized protein n=1 Tax=Pyricularia grisea TaxID=148305 RepID=A0A6P8B769_PYRGI|nr:hypothetical protein PgNI_05468 [Pyricularia grisea]TLD11093.1 hypothetical protein PgNI_05468 [Pyricularia grisea]